MDPEQAGNIEHTHMRYRRELFRLPRVTLSRGYVGGQFARNANAYTFTVKTTQPDGTTTRTIWEMRRGRPGLRCMVWQERLDRWE